MDFTKVKLIVTDMDGTLLNSRGELDKRFFEILEQITALGIRFAVASGRQYYALRNLMEPVKDELLFIAENGSIVMKGGEQKHLQPMVRETAMEIVKILKEIGEKYVIVCGKEAAYIEDTNPEFMKPFLQHYDRYEVVDDICKVNPEDILKVTVCDLSGAEENTLPHVEHLKAELNVKLSGKIWVDFTHKEAQKGNALKKLQEIYGISEDETMAFGDYLNDLELFDHAKFSYAMENAHPEVLEKAPFKARSNDENGVLLVLEELLEAFNKN